MAKKKKEKKGRKKIIFIAILKLLRPHRLFVKKEKQVQVRTTTIEEEINQELIWALNFELFRGATPLNK